MNNSVKNNSKALKTTVCNTEQYKNSFFIKSVIHWNQLDEEIVHAKTVESFKTAFQHRQYIYRCSLSRRVKTSKWYLRRIDTGTDVNKENSGCSFYFTQNISERKITGTAKVLSDLLGRSRFYSFNIHTKYRESCDKPILTKRGIPRC